MVSVAMASYNGEKYIGKQIETILDNLLQEDELVISDDGSSDETLQIINSFHDERIHLYEGPKEGINQNFANAIKHCKGEYIFLSDQDDEWYSNKVSTVMKAFKSSHCLVVQHDAIITDNQGKTIIDSFANYRRVRSGFLKNYFRNTYHGCCMAFSARIINDILPFPKTGCFHDNWIGLIANLNGETLFIDDMLMNYKRYENNSSSFIQYPKKIQLKNRIHTGINIIFYLTNRKKRI